MGYVCRPADGAGSYRVRTGCAFWQCDYFDERDSVRSMGELSRRRSVSDRAQQKCAIPKFWHSCNASFARAPADGEPVEPERPKTGWHELVVYGELCRQFIDSPCH